MLGKERIDAEISGKYHVGDIRHCFADIRLARRVLGYQPQVSFDEGFHSDERSYHFGLKRADGSEKLLYRLWSDGGIPAVHDAYWLGKCVHAGGGDEKPVLITGGCGFIGTNVADRILSSGQPVLLFDNLSRPGVERNLQWLRQSHGDRMRIVLAPGLPVNFLAGHRERLERRRRRMLWQCDISAVARNLRTGHARGRPAPAGRCSREHTAKVRGYLSGRRSLLLRRRHDMVAPPSRRPVQ